MPASTIIVQYRDGSPGKRVRVSLGFLRGGTTESAFTGRDGMAVVEHSGVGRAKVLVRGRACGTFHAPGRYAATIEG